jgi:CDP-paratose 2-epimerase
MTTLPSRILVTGGAGFVGANLCLALAQRSPGSEVIALDSLKRRGSELNLARLRKAGVTFVHGDVRERADLMGLEPVEAIVECSAEPSVLAGMGAGADFVVQTNLVGAHNCLELARRDGAQFVFLSTSRVYPVGALSELALNENDTRFELAAEQAHPGASEHGIAEDFPLGGARTLYGATKLAAELLVTEYADAFGVPAVIDRCGVIAGPWQMGKVDQGVFTHWLLAHRLRRPLTYIGYGGTGKQVRDLLHVDDLCELILEQLGDAGAWDGATLNVGGGVEGSLSLRETTDLCRELTGHEVPIGPVGEPRPGDVPFYASDCRALFERTAWRPARGPRTILEDTLAWIEANEHAVMTALG